MPDAASAAGAAHPVTAATADNRAEPPQAAYAAALGELAHAEWVVGRMQAKVAKAAAAAETLVAGAQQALADAEADAQAAHDRLETARAALPDGWQPTPADLDPRRAAILAAELGLDPAALDAALKRARKATGKGGQS